MKAQASVLREAIRDILTESVTIQSLPQKYKFIEPDTAKLLYNAVWRFAADVVKGKNNGQVDQSQVQDVAADTGMSLGTHLNDLIRHFVGDQAQQAKPVQKQLNAFAKTQVQSPQGQQQQRKAPAAPPPRSQTGAREEMSR